MKLLSVAEICADYTVPATPPDLQGWNSDHPLFAELVKLTQPRVIIEVGSWKGASALHMAELTAELGTQLYCCDTWLGAFHPPVAATDAPAPLQYRHSDLYHQFLLNVMQSGYAGRIHPIPLPSIEAARVLAHAGVAGEMVYIDASHRYHDVMGDLEYYSALVAPQGVLFGDDYRDFPGVRMAVNRFAFEQNLRVAISGPAWVLQPTSWA